jgi:short-subunit dehydrogenase
MEQKKAMVTGASEGIGREFCIQLAKEGYQITAVARNESRLKELVQGLTGTGTHSTLVADLTNPLNVTKVATELNSNHYDLLINNAGFGVYGKFHEVPLAKLQEMSRLNCDALVHLSHAYLSSAQKGDALVNVASTLAFLPLPGAALYAATKAFVTSLSESLWFEQKGRGVFVMDFCPGATSTLFHERSGGNAKTKPPAAITQTAAVAVKVAIRAIHKRKTPTVISGSTNLALASFTRLLPRKSVVKMMGSIR